MKHHLQILVAFNRLHKFRDRIIFLRYDLSHHLIPRLHVCRFSTVCHYLISAEYYLVGSRALRLDMNDILGKFHNLLLNTSTRLRAPPSVGPLLRDHDLAIDESLLSDHKLDKICLVCRRVQERDSCALLAQICLSHQLMGRLCVVKTRMLYRHRFCLERSLSVVYQVLVNLSTVFHVYSR